MGSHIWASIGLVVAALHLTHNMDRTNEGARSAYIFQASLIKGPAYNLRLDSTSPRHFQSEVPE